MRHAIFGAALCLAAGALCVTALPGETEASSRLHRFPSSPVVVITAHGYRWEMPAFRMAGRKAYALVYVVNPHEYVLSMRMTCRTGEKMIPELSGQYLIAARQTMQVDTRRFHHRMQKGDGVRVRCTFRANGSADVQAWVFDRDIQREIGRGLGAPYTTS